MPKTGPPGSEERLPRSIFVPKQDPRKDARETVDSILSDRFMAFLSILLLPIILIPLFFSLSSSALSFIDICDGTIVVFFVVEYLSKLYLSENRWAFFKSPWHIVDLTVVILSFVSYLPLIGLGGRGSTTLLLRLVRLPRALAVGGRTAASRIRPAEVQQVVVEEVAQTVIRRVGPDFKESDNLSWEDVERALKTTEQEWIDIHNVNEEGILRLSKMLRVPPHEFKAKRVDDIYPHIAYVQQMSFIFLQAGRIKYPETSEHFMTILRLGETIICSGPKIITVSPHGEDTFKSSLADTMAQPPDHRSFVILVLYGILDASLRQYRSLFSEIELEISAISNTPRWRLPKDFLRRMYELNKEVVRLVSNLTHFRELLGVAVTRELPIDGFDDSIKEDFQTLQEETSYLNEVADDIVENTRTMIDLYINQSSFETNRILKILAVVTVMSIIPAALSGILGTNLPDVPYPLVLWQLILVTGIAMTFSGYCFYRLGWLRS